MVCNMQVLGLHRNQIGDAGMQALSTALAGGAMASLTPLSYLDISVDDPEHPALRAACDARVNICLY